MPKYLLDTNALVALTNGNPNVSKRFRKEVALTDCEIITTALNYYEFTRGLTKLKGDFSRSVLRKQFLKIVKLVFFGRLEDFDRGAAIYRQTHNGTGSSGSGPDDVDVLTAAIALSVNATIVTHDPDFNGISNIKVENWET